MISDHELQREVSKLLKKFYEKRIENLDNLDLLDVIKRKNPYLFRATGNITPEDVVEAILSAYISSSDETIFGNIFVEPLAIFVAENSFYSKTKKAHKSGSAGIDIDIIDERTHTLVAVKSGPNGFNSQSKSKQKTEFHAARRRLSASTRSVNPMVGYSYGTRASNNGDYSEKSGQSFWEFITGDELMHRRVIEQIGADINDHNQEFRIAFDKAKAKFIAKFMKYFVNHLGEIDWQSMVGFTSEPLTNLGVVARNLGMKNTELRAFLEQHQLPYFGTESAPKFSSAQIKDIENVIASNRI